MMMGNNFKTIMKVLNDRLCTGCCTCVSLCPNGALRIIKDNNGIFIPQLNESICNGCGTCLMVCPAYNADFVHLNKNIFGKEPEDILIGNYLNCYGGWANDKDIRFNSSSGGLITQLLIFLLEKGVIDRAVIVKTDEKIPFEPKPFIASTKDDLIESSNSKYCPVPLNMVLNQIIKSEGEKFAVVGLPCHIHGLRKAEQYNETLKNKIIVHIGIMCGTTKNFHATEFQLKRMGINKKNVKKIEYRGNGWPGYLSLHLKNGEIVHEKYMKYYDFNFCAFTPWRCLLCSDHTCELSDISFGDAWLDEFSKDKLGTSIIVSRNETGEVILHNAFKENYIKFKKIDSSKVALSQKMCRFKKNQLKARRNIVQLFGKAVPQDNMKLFDSGIKDYFWAIYFYALYIISSKKRFWILLDFQNHLINLIKIFKRGI